MLIKGKGLPMQVALFDFKKVTYKPAIDIETVVEQIRSTTVMACKDIWHRVCQSEYRLLTMAYQIESRRTLSVARRKMSLATQHRRLQSGIAPVRFISLGT